MVSSDEIVKRFAGYRPNPTLQEVAVRQDEGVEHPRDAAEDACGALLPGDDPSGHPLHDPNPWLGKLPSSIKAALASGELDEADAEKARRALLVIARTEGGDLDGNAPFKEPSCGRPSPVRRVGW